MIPVQITLRDLPASQALETKIQEKAEKLTQFYNHILNCHVVIESPQKHKQQGKIYSVRLEVSVPDQELVVTHKEDEDVYIALRDAFDALKRQLSDYAHRRRGDVKTHNQNNKDPLIH